MRKNVIRNSIVASLIFSATMSVNAKHQITKNATSGEATYISDNFNCKGGKISAVISTRPTNGSATVVTKNEAISAKKLKMSNFPSCEGKIMKIIYIQYKSNPGYKGGDKIGVKWSGTNREFIYNVNVK